MSKEGLRGALTELKIRTRDQILWSSSGVEVGVSKGEHALKMLIELKPRMLYLVDPYESYENANGKTVDQGLLDQDRLEMYERLLRSKAYAGWRHISLPSVAAADLFPDHSMLFVYIDGWHTEEAVREDIRSWWPKVLPGGMLCGHDYANTGAGRGVKAATGEFAERQNLTLHTGYGRDWWVWKPEDHERTDR